MASTRPAPLCTVCNLKPQSAPDAGKTTTCVGCKQKVHRKIKQTSKQFAASGMRLKVQQAVHNTVATINKATGEVERIDKQDLVNRGVCCFAGIKPRRASKIEQAKTRATSAIAQVRLRERRRRQAQHAQHAHA